MTPFEELVDKLDTFVSERMSSRLFENQGGEAGCYSQTQMENARKSLVAAIEAIHSPRIDMRAISRERMEAVFCHRPTDPGLSPPDPDRWAKAALKAAAFDAKFIGVNWDNISVAGQDHWRLVADAVRNVKP
jgi:hypothetical protein